MPLTRAQRLMKLLRQIVVSMALRITTGSAVRNISEGRLETPVFNCRTSLNIISFEETHWGEAVVLGVRKTGLGKVREIAGVKAVILGCGGLRDVATPQARGPFRTCCAKAIKEGPPQRCHKPTPIARTEAGVTLEKAEIRFGMDEKQTSTLAVKGNKACFDLGTREASGCIQWRGRCYDVEQRPSRWLQSRVVQSDERVPYWEIRCLRQ